MAFKRSSAQMSVNATLPLLSKSWLSNQAVASCTACDYAANVKKAELFVSTDQPKSKEKNKRMQKVSTPDIKTIDALADFLNTPPQNLVKTLIFESDKGVVAGLTDAAADPCHLSALWRQ